MIFLTSKDDEVDELLGLRMGADDYIKKPFSQRLLIERIRALIRRGELARERDDGQGEPVIVRGQMTLDPARHLCTWRGQPVELTVTEFLILKSLAQRPGHVKNRDQLMDAAYGEHIYVDDRTIDSHIKRLRKKFKAVDGDSRRSKPSMASAIDTATADATDPPRRAPRPGAGRRRSAAGGPPATPPSRRRAGPAPDRAARRAVPGWRPRWPRVSPLTRRIVAVNVLPLALLALGFLYLGRFEASLIGQQIESLHMQGQIFAAALSEGAVLELGRRRRDPAARICRGR